MNMVEQMNLEDYKQKVKECLMTTHKHTTREAERLMTLYEDDFPEFLNDKWKPSVAASAMIAGY